MTRLSNDATVGRGEAPYRNGNTTAKAKNGRSSRQAHRWLLNSLLERIYVQCWGVKPREVSSECGRMVVNILTEDLA
jgi:hypothetical protein